MTRTVRRHTAGKPTRWGKPETSIRRRWACPSQDCTQERITPISTTKAPICPVCSVNMTKRRKVRRAR